MVATTLVGCGSKDSADKEESTVVEKEDKDSADKEESTVADKEDTDEAESDSSTEVEIQFNVPTEYIESIGYSYHSLYLYGDRPFDVPIVFDCEFYIDENCKWIIVDSEGNENELTEEGNETAAQEFIDLVTTGHNISASAREEDDYNLNIMHENNPDNPIFYHLKLKGTSDTITEALLINNFAGEDYYDNHIVTPD